jgi:hypothetical protein
LKRRESLARQAFLCFRLAIDRSWSGEGLKLLGATILGLSLMMTAHADRGRSSGRPGDDKSRLESGISRFMFDGWEGPELRVWTYVPSSVSADAPILFVMHGVERDAKRYIEDWARTAERYGVILIAPEFDERRFPGPEAYNQGGVIDPRTGRKRNPETWTFSVIEPLFDEVKQRTNSRTQTYSLYGHSAGAQFVHRFVMLAHPVRLDHAVAANAGWYTLFDPDRPFPQGMKLNKQDYVLDRSGFAERLTILLGTEDIESDDRNLRDDAWSRGQGQNRFERGQAFFLHAKQVAGSGSPAFNWRLKYAPGVAHENRKMALYAASILFRQNRRETQPEFLLELRQGDSPGLCDPADRPSRQIMGLSNFACGALSGARVEAWAARSGSMQQDESAVLLDQPVGISDAGELPHRLASSLKVALIDAEGRDPRESARLERKVEDVARRGADLILLINSATDGRIRKTDRYTLFHLPRQKQGRRERDAGCAACDRPVLISFVPDPRKRTVRIQVYPSRAAGLTMMAADTPADPSQWRTYVEAVRRIVARTKDKVRFDAGQDELGDHLSFEIDWPRRE